MMKAILEDTGLQTACDTFYRLPDDNSQLSQKCSEWVGTLMREEPVNLLEPFCVDQQYNFIFSTRDDGRGFQWYGCDNWNWGSYETLAQGRWKVYVR